MLSKSAGTSITEEKIGLLRQIAMEEFSQNGYQGTSTNVITQRAGISKGSLFNIFGNKKNLYFELIGESNSFFIKGLEAQLHNMSTDFVERMLWLANLYLDLFIKEPQQFLFLMTLTDPGNRELAAEFYQQHIEDSMAVQAKIYAGIDMDSLKIDSTRMMKITSWVMTEIKNDLFSNPAAREDPKKFKTEFIGELEEMLQILKHGMYKD